MERFEYLIIGGGLAGAKCAGTLRKLGAEGRVGLMSAEDRPPYHRPPLSKGVLLGREDQDSVFVYSHGFFEKKGIDLLLDTRAVALDPDRRVVRDQRREAWSYDKLLIATGSDLIRLNVPGDELDGVIYLRTLPHCLQILEWVGHAKQAVVIGAGFIGMELASAFVQKGIETTMIVRQKQLFTKIGSPELADYFTNYYREQGVNLVFEDSVERFEGQTQVSGVVTKSGKRFPCQLAAVGIGVAPGTKFLQGGKISLDNGVLTDEHLRTNMPDVYAAGDVANFWDPVFEKRRHIEHWDNAGKQGELAAKNMVGEETAYNTVSYFFSDLFDLSFEFLGDNSETDEVITRGALEDKSAWMFFVKGNRLMAGFLLGDAARDRKEVERVILERIDLSRYRASLKDPGLALAEIR